MYLGIDIGASKTLLASFNNLGEITNEAKFPTPADYKDFINQLKNQLDNPDFQKVFSAVCCAVPGLIDHQKGVGKFFGNLSWHNVPIKADLQDIFPDAVVLVENDTKLAALYEAIKFKDKYKKVLYLTISTGISAGVVNDSKLDPVLEDSEPGQMLLNHGGKLKKWESFASGKALVKKYGKPASEIDDPQIWRGFAADVAIGLETLIAVIQPEVVIIGGGVGAHLEKFKSFLESTLQKEHTPLVSIPPIVKAKHAEEAVIYGCYEYIKQNT